MKHLLENVYFVLMSVHFRVLQVFDYIGNWLNPVSYTAPYTSLANIWKKNILRVKLAHWYLLADALVNPIFFLFIG